MNTARIVENIISLHQRGEVSQVEKLAGQFEAEVGADVDSLIVLANTLTDIGLRQRAIETLQKIIETAPPTEVVYMLMAKLAIRLEAYEVAVKILTIAASLNPTNPAHYVNIADCYRRLEDYDNAIGLLQQVIPSLPDSATLWNALATTVLHGRQDHANAEIFYNKALELDPENDQVLLNLANFYSHKPEAKELYRRAISVNEENHQAHLGLSIDLLSEGKFAEGWSHYEHRLKIDSGYKVALRATNKLPMWEGSNLEGKAILVMPEQGLGDEIFFARAIPRLIESASKVVIACDPRLVSIYGNYIPK